MARSGGSAQDLDRVRRELNEYLLYEFGVDMAEEDVSAERPFQLELAGHFGTGRDAEPVFMFVADGEDYYAFSNPMDFLPRAGMSVDDVRLQEAGSNWIASRDPVDLETSRLGDERVPSTPERGERLEQLVARRSWRARIRRSLSHLRPLLSGARTGS